MTECIVCGRTRDAEAETARVRCNVRRFKHESFGVWRCGGCRSIHTDAEVDLDHYYEGYPVFVADLDWKLKVVYASQLARLRAAGLQSDHRILDHGCGAGLLVRYLRGHGYDTSGWDRYAAEFSDDAVLQQHYDCVVSQDVIEHVDDPHALLKQFDELARPGGLISIGTPDAAALDLSDPEDYVHALHQPYHRHILSMQALVEAGEGQGWTVERRHSTMYNNTLFPTMNPRFALHYVRCHDDVWDLVAEPVRVNWKLFTPKSMFFAAFGYFFDRHTDIQVIFRKAVA